MGEEVRLWLDQHKIAKAREKAFDSISPVQGSLDLLSESFMSLVPEFIAVNDPELNPTTIVSWSESCKGISQLNNDTSSIAVDETRPFDLFNKSELQAAFSLSKTITDPQQMDSSFLKLSSLEVNSKSVHGATLMQDLGKSKRGRFYDSFSSTGPRSTSNSPVPLTFNSTSTDAQSPPSATPVKAVVANSTGGLGTPPPPLPPGPPPSRKGSIAGAAEMDVRGFVEREDLASDDSIPTGDVKEIPSVPLDIPKILIDEYSRILGKVIHVTDWPRSVRGVIRALRNTGLPHGNPFVAALVHEGTNLDAMSVVKGTQLDLKTIAFRVRHRSHYRWFYEFENDLRLVAANAFESQPRQGKMRIIAEHFSRVVERELKASVKAIYAATDAAVH